MNADDIKLIPPPPEDWMQVSVAGKVIPRIRARDTGGGHIAIRCEHPYFFLSYHRNEAHALFRLMAAIAGKDES